MSALYQDGPGGMTNLGVAPEAAQARLRALLEAGRAALGGRWEQSSARREIFWINVWQRAGGALPMALEGVREVDRWARELVDRAYPGERVVCDGYGFIVNPIGTKAQSWHIDYNRDYSSLFIPLSRLTPENCLQYAMLPPGGGVERCEQIELDELVERCGYVSVRQMLARPFSILRLDFGAIHRGVANTGGFERVMFFVSVYRNGQAVPPEAEIEILRAAAGK